ncbi:MAG: (E)-4-hydroxy-3-methylbut-2-enyl-diphosphate synthase [Treponema sp.]|jgi:(E)-4-hydroxy-3-methylbut-2-enyl-diphosphate synthase|nr:(E)-4-hydroxy-3-methylbut-2-enyl-diphosphate synthase [Treponema sp.]
MFYKSRQITIGGFDSPSGGHIKAVSVGGGSPVLIQTMWKDRLSLSDLEGDAARGIVARIERLARMGCGLLRFAVPSLADADAVGRLAGMVSMPLAADIHFDYKIALRCMDFPIAKIRLNPGNIGGREKVQAVLEKAGEKGIAIRIGVNAGSLPQDLRTQDLRGRADTAGALLEAAERELAILKKINFTNVLVSMKASGIADTIKVNRIFAERNDVPLHVGVTEAGPLLAGTARSGAALIPLLAEGIGDTLRVSLSDTMENEVIAAREICGAAAEIAAFSGNAAAARLRRDGVTVVSCPRCGRYGFDTHGFISRWLPRLYEAEKRMTVAVMGCEVNGPEEARHADLGITGTGNKVLIFRRGSVVRTVSAVDADEAFAEELEFCLLQMPK